MNRTTYAKDTSVSVARSKAEIEYLVTNYGATGFLSAWEGTRAFIQFRISERTVRFTLHLPDRTDKKYREWKPRQRKAVTDESVQAKWEQECRSHWRALMLCVKAKLISVESGIETMEQAFLAHIVIPGTSQTIGDYALPRLAESYSQNKALPFLP